MQEEVKDILEEIEEGVVEQPEEAEQPEEVEEVEEQADNQEGHSEEAHEEVWPKKAANAVSRLKKEKAEYRRQRDEMRAEIERLKAMKIEDPAEPKEEEFDNYSDFMDAKATFRAEQVLNNRDRTQNEQRVESLQTQSERLYIEERSDVFESRLDELKQSAPDYQEVEAYAEQVVVSYPDNLKKAILAVDNAPKALYNLAKEGRLENLAYMPIEAAMAEVVQAQYRDSAGVQPRQAPRKTVTSAPRPIKSVSGTGKQSKQLHEMSADDVWAQFQEG